MTYENQIRPMFAEMVPECRKWSIGRTRAFELARLGLIDTFRDGRKRYVLIASLESLPSRLRQNGGAK